MAFHSVISRRNIMIDENKTGYGRINHGSDNEDWRGDS